MKRVLVLVATLLVGHPAVAEVAFDAGLVVKEQNDRVKEAYTRYLDACFELSDEEKMGLEASISGTLQVCEDAKEAYDREGSLLVRLIHGDASLVVCVDDGNCSWSVEEMSD